MNGYIILYYISGKFLIIFKFIFLVFNISIKFTNDWNNEIIINNANNSYFKYLSS